MRINNGVLVDNMMRNLQDNMGKLDELNQQLSSGKEFQDPSQDPIGAANSMDLEGVIAGHDQYLRNLDQSRDWLKSSESALNNAGKILQRAREQAVYGSTGSLSEDDQVQIAEEIGELKEELINLGNSQLGGRYLFAGQQTRMEGEQPFELNGDDVEFNGDNRSIERELGPGVTMQINVDGQQVFQQAIEDLDQLQADLEQGNTKEVNQMIGNIDQAIDKNVESRAQLGARINRLDMAENKLEDEKLQSEELLSRNEDVDMAKTITDLKMQENVYRASLASGARIMQPTLVDFLQ